MKLLKIVLLYSSLFILLACDMKSAVVVYSDIKPKPIEKVSLQDYADVQTRDAQDPDLSLGIAISGGGSRAQYFGLGILMALEELRPCEGGNVKCNGTGSCDPKFNFLQDIDYYSTVSGGGFAAGYYLSAKKNGLIKPNETLLQFWLSPDRAETYSEEIQYDATIGNLLSKKFKKYERGWQHPTSFPNIIDEQLLQAGRGPANSKLPSLKLSDFFAKAGSKPATPMFVPNGTIYNNGERLPFMPHILKALKINKSEMSKEPLCENCKPGQYHDGFSMPLKYAVAASSAFPGLIPQVKFKVEDKRFLRVVDGGAVDNLGYVTLVDVLAADDAKRSANRKRALVVDCSGEGLTEIYGDSALNKFDLLSHSLFFTISTKYKTFETDIAALMKEKGLPNRKERDFLKIGITDLRDTAHRIRDKVRNLNIPKENVNMANQLNSLNAKQNKKAEDIRQAAQITTELQGFVLRVDTADLSAQVILDSLNRDKGKRITKTERTKRWNKYFDMFMAMLEPRLADYKIKLPDKIPSHLNKIDFLESKDFQKFTGKDRDLLILFYELAAQVETNVKIPSSREKSILILAGRYTVYLNREKLKCLYRN